MEKEELLKRIAKAFNAGDKEVKIAYDAFLQKLSEELEPDEAIRIPGYGIFQIKGKAEDKYNKPFDLIKNKEYQLLYYPEDLNDVVELDFSYTKKSRQNASESAFSLSSGKPIIPILESQKKELLVQSSYLNLQTAFREKADEIFNDSLKLENFSIDSEKQNIKIDLTELQNEDIPSDTANTIPWNFGDEIEFEDTKHTANPEAPETFEDAPETFPVEQVLSDEHIPADTDEDRFEIDINDIKAFEFDPFTISSENTPQDETLKNEDESFIKDENLYMNIPDFQENTSDDFIKDEAEINLDHIEDINFAANEDTAFPENEISDTESVSYESAGKESEENIMEDSENENSEDEDKDEVITIDVARTQDYRTIRSAPLSEVEDNDVRVGFSKWFWIVLSALIITTGGGIYYFGFYNKAESGNNQVAEVNNKKKVDPQIVERDYEVPVTIIPKSEEETSGAVTNESETKPSEPKENVPEKLVESIPAKKTDPEKGNKPQIETVKPSKTEQSITTAVVSGFERKDSKNTLVKDFIFSDGTKYTIQLSSWKSRVIAEKEVSRLRDLGMDAYYTESYVPSAGGTRYRVRVGEYSSVKGAEDALEKMK